jgi:hypothetical protein
MYKKCKEIQKVSRQERELCLRQFLVMKAPIHCVWVYMEKHIWIQNVTALADKV